MVVCSKCGLPSNGSAVCPNCGSTSFKTIGVSQQSHHASVSQGYDPYSTQILNRRGVNMPVGNHVYSSARPAQRVGVLPKGDTGKAAAAAAGAATASRSVAAIVLPIIFALIALIAAIVIPVAVTSSNGPEKTIAKLETAMNDLDINGMVDCFDSTLRDAYSAGSDLMDGLLGFGYETAADLMPFLSELTGEDMDMPQFQIDVLDKQEVSETSCILTIRIATYYDGEETDVEEGPVEMVKEDGKWYIASDDLIDDISSSLF